MKRTPRKKFKLRHQKKKLDIWMLIIPAILTIFGLIMIFEASNVIAFRDFSDKYHYVKDQFVWMSIGMVGMVVVSLINYRRFYSISVVFMLVTIISLILVLIPGVGVKALGAKRWLNFGIISFQPSELAKLSIILYLSSWFSSKEKGRFIAFLLLFGTVVGLILVQPDLGTAFLIAVIFLLMYFLSGAPLRNFFILIPLFFVGLLMMIYIAPYRLARLTTFLNPSYDPLGASYHIRQVLIAFGSGGFWGVGLGASRQKYQYLPEATTDSIFAIIGEEFGFLGASVVILVYILLIIKIFRISKQAEDKHAYLLSAGILTLLALQTIINLGSMVAIFPLTGVPLPFISYGGSNLIVLLVSMGILANISKYKN